MRSFTTLFAALTIAALIFPATAATAFANPAPATWYVDDDGMGSATGCDGSDVPLTPYIQDAVDNANPGDTIMVCPGFYSGQLDISKSLTIRSVKRWAAHIETHPDDTPGGDLISIHDATGVVLHGFQIWSAFGACHIVSALVRVNNAPDTVVSGNRIKNPDDGPDGCVYDHGVEVAGSSDGTQMLRNRITDFVDDGISDTSAGTVTIRDNHINYFHAIDNPFNNNAEGILAEPSAGGVAKVHRNRIDSLDSAGSTTPQLAYGIAILGGAVDVGHNTAHNVGTFVYVLGRTSGTIQRNRGIENIQSGLFLSDSTNIEVAHNRMAGATAGVIASSSTGNDLHDNDWTGPGPNDCLDNSSGSGTANTGNTWTNNYGGESSPAGICTPAP
jgi:hypothetical protein